MHTTATDEELSIPKAIVTDRVARLRLLTGVLQGLVLYALYFSLKSASWPATNAYLFATLALIFLFVPVLFISGLGHLESRRMWIWMAVAALICVVLGTYDIWRMGFIEGRSWLGGGTFKRMPSGLLLFFAAAGFYIAHALVLAAAKDQRRIARYPSYFESAWQLLIQIKLSALFVGVLWLILWLGATLFMLVKLNFLQKLLDQSWFVIPVTVFAFSTALHITDVRPGIVRGIRSLLLVLMSWLLPITTLIVGGFLISLPFTGLEPLWATRHATSVLLGSTAVLVVLINTAFQSGEVGKEVARVLRVSARLACVLLLPMTLIAIYSLTLRVQQYGWTSDRVIAAACLLVAISYACGYLWAAVERDAWLARIAPTNVLTAFLTLVVLLAMFTPIADPARLSVANQLARLETGKVSAAQFDFDFLRFEGARYGNDALQKLKAQTTGADAELIRKRAEAALQKKNKWNKDGPAANAQTRADSITVWPKGASLPAAFLAQNWTDSSSNYMLPECLKRQDQKCNAYLLDLKGDGKAEILLKNAQDYGRLVVFSLESDGKWSASGTIDGLNAGCKDVAQALEDGSYRAVPPMFQDLEVAGQRLHVQPWPAERSKCERVAKPK